MTPARRLLVLLPSGTDADTATPLLLAAAALAAAQGTSLGVLELRAQYEPAIQPPALATQATWWRLTHRDWTRVDADSMLCLMPEALEAADWDAAAPSLLLLPSGVGEELAARLAGRLSGAALGRVFEVTLVGDQVQVARAGWGGHARVTLVSRARLCVACWRPTARTIAAPSFQPAVRDTALQTILPAPPLAEAVTPSDSLPALEGARLVVSGGRGMQGEEGFEWLRRVALKLGAALGGSLPTVDAGWVPVSRQVGQSGKYVTPLIYLAVGISGTPQHMAGVAPETRIIAINKDPEAPIFGLAETGVVADWSQLLPLLCEQLYARMSDNIS